jgi:hypothetical protein
MIPQRENPETVTFFSQLAPALLQLDKRSIDGAQPLGSLVAGETQIVHDRLRVLVAERHRCRLMWSMNESGLII